jgi:outer membrane protein TolC
MMPTPARFRVVIVSAVIFTSSFPSVALAQGPERLTLSDALTRAAANSEVIQIAKSGEARTSAQISQISSQYLPQINFAGTYTRTLASEFENAFSSSGTGCAPLTVDATRPVADRVTELERAAGCGGIGGGGLDFSTLPFGQRNIYQLGFTFAQSVYTGGRVGAQVRQADVSHRIATLETTATETQLKLDVARAFYAAALSDRLVTIAESTATQASATYEQARLAFEAGRTPEYELLRALVGRDNQRPNVIRQRANRDVAYLRLRQLLQLPPNAPLVLDVDLESPDLPPPAPFAADLAKARQSNTADRVTVTQAEALVDARSAGVAIARSGRLPSLGVSSSYARVGYPSQGNVVPGFGDFRTNWSVGATVSMPIFNGGRVRAEEHAAAAELDQARLLVIQARELAVLDAATANEDLDAAAANWEASAGTVQQAERAYQIAELRNRSGLSTQLELADARLSLEIAQANRAQAAHDLQVARARVALLPTLPLAAR